MATEDDKMLVQNEIEDRANFYEEDWSSFDPKKVDEYMADILKGLSLVEPGKVDVAALKQYYVLVFWNLPVVRDLDLLREQFVFTLNRSMQLIARGVESSIVAEKCAAFVRDEHEERMQKFGNTRGNRNVLICSWMIVPLADRGQALALQKYWNDNPSYRGKRIKALQSYKFGKEFDQ